MTLLIIFLFGPRESSCSAQNDAKKFAKQEVGVKRHGQISSEVDSRYSFILVFSDYITQSIADFVFCLYV